MKAGQPPSRVCQPQTPICCTTAPLISNVCPCAGRPPGRVCKLLPGQHGAGRVHPLAGLVSADPQSHLCRAVAKECSPSGWAGPRSTAGSCLRLRLRSVNHPPTHLPTHLPITVCMHANSYASILAPPPALVWLSLTLSIDQSIDFTLCLQVRLQRRLHTVLLRLHAHRGTGCGQHHPRHRSGVHGLLAGRPAQRRACVPVPLCGARYAVPASSSTPAATHRPTHPCAASPPSMLALSCAGAGGLTCLFLAVFNGNPGDIGPLLNGAVRCAVCVCPLPPPPPPPRAVAASCRAPPPRHPPPPLPPDNRPTCRHPGRGGVDHGKLRHGAGVGPCWGACLGVGVAHSVPPVGSRHRVAVSAL